MSVRFQYSRFDTDQLLQKDSDSIYKLEPFRKESFKNWPNLWIQPEKLTVAGFYYTGEEDKVLCFECEIGLFKWKENSDPIDEHKQWSPMCRFIRGIPCGNVPIGIGPAILVMPKKEDVCETRNSQERSRSSLSPKHSKYATYHARLASFATWIKVLKHLIEKLAIAGLFYTGWSDRTDCYQCGVKLVDWAVDDDPWQKHAQFSRDCSYLLRVKKSGYVAEVIKRTG